MAGGFLTLTNLAASAVNDFMLDSDQGPTNDRFVEVPSVVSFAINATAAEAEYEVFAGSRTVISRSRVPSGGTAAVPPSITDFGRSFLAAAGEILQFRVRETAAAGTVDLNLTYEITPLG